MTPTPTRDLAKLRSPFLAGLDPAEQNRIFDLSEQATPALLAWTARFPLIRPVRVPPLSLSVAAGAPFGPVQALISTARLSLWIFTLDDLFDEARMPLAELIERAECYRALAHGTIRCPSGDRLAVALCEVRDDLAGYALFESLGVAWADALCGTIDGMLSEYRWSRAYNAGRTADDAMPSYAEYVRIGRYSIGGPPHVWAAVITADDASTPAHLEHLSAMEKLASTCIRLANDLRSYEKEIAEGQINALVILSQALRDKGVPQVAALQQAVMRVQADIRTGLDSLAALRHTGGTDTGRPEAVIDNIARFVCDFYAHHDYHTFTGHAA